MIRNAKIDDLERITELFNIGRNFMRQNGNNSQWINGYPSEELLRNDISQNNLYVEETDSELTGVFAFILGEDATYKKIYEGKWLNDEPYGTIHRIASDGIHHGFFQRTLDFCAKKTDNIRVDTHADNKPMQNTLSKAGFTYCGIIYIEDGSPRVAFQKAGVQEH